MNFVEKLKMSEFLIWVWMNMYICAAFPQDLHNKEKAGEEDASEQADPPLDSDENR
jgi:hypothetical protein